MTVLDNLSRAGDGQNLHWLQDGTRFDFERVDIRDRAEVERVFSETRFDAVIHLAAQVAVTTSVTDPRTDFMINALGTFNLLEAVAPALPGGASSSSPRPTRSTARSTGAKVALHGSRYAYSDRPHGIDEQQPLDFLSPYGCSKGAADQYMLDYARIYGLPATSFRQSCIYGTRQFGIEDQGWVAWFTIASRLRPQHHDLRRRQAGARRAVRRRSAARLRGRDRLAGQDRRAGLQHRRRPAPCPVAGRAGRAAREEAWRRKIPLKWDDWRPGDQRVYISDIRKLETVLGWKPEVGVAEGVGQLANWVQVNEHLFATPAESRVTTTSQASALPAA